MKKLALVFAGFASAAVGCSSSSETVKELDTALETHGQTSSATVGVKPDGQAVVQKQESAAAALMTLEHVNENLKLDVRHEFFLLRDCREKLALAAGPGGREYPELSGFEEIQASYEKHVELGLVDGELRVVETSPLALRLESQRKLQADLHQVLRTVKEQKQRCMFLQKAQQAD